MAETIEACDEPEPKREVDVLVIKQVGAVILSFGVAEHDSFADELYGHIKDYPQDAP